MINAAFECGIKDLIFLGSSCVYPRLCKQPIKEKYLLNGELEKSKEPYAIAKIAGIKLCESYNYQYGTNYLCLMPTNTFGPNVVTFAPPAVPINASAVPTSHNIASIRPAAKSRFISS